MSHYFAVQVLNVHTAWSHYYQSSPCSRFKVKNQFPDQLLKRRRRETLTKRAGELGNQIMSCSNFYEPIKAQLWVQGGQTAHVHGRTVVKNTRLYFYSPFCTHLYKCTCQGQHFIDAVWRFKFVHKGWIIFCFVPMSNCFWKRFIFLFSWTTFYLSLLLKRKVNCFLFLCFYCIFLKKESWGKSDFFFNKISTF